jgi:hypothetical protein
LFLPYLKDVTISWILVTTFWYLNEKSGEEVICRELLQKKLLHHLDLFVFLGSLIALLVGAIPVLVAVVHDRSHLLKMIGVVDLIHHVHNSQVDPVG